MRSEKMDATVEKTLREFEKRSDSEWARIEKMDRPEMLQHLDEFLLSVGPATGQLINLLAKESRAQVILEVGSSFGYSTVWLAEAARETGGKVVSIEVHADKQKHARATIERAGLAGFVDFRLGDARELLSKLDERIDFVLLDIWKDLYIPCFDLFYPKLRPSALIVADNMTYPEESRQDAEAYRKHVKTKANIQSVLLPVGSGLELSRFK
jgi:predicted O-methyltransferase YrrM